MYTRGYPPGRHIGRLYPPGGVLGGKRGSFRYKTMVLGGKKDLIWVQNHGPRREKGLFPVQNHGPRKGKRASFSAQQWSGEGGRGPLSQSNSETGVGETYCACPTVKRVFGRHIQGCTPTNGVKGGIYREVYLRVYTRRVIPQGVYQAGYTSGVYQAGYTSGWVYTRWVYLRGVYTRVVYLRVYIPGKVYLRVCMPPMVYLRVCIPPMVYLRVYIYLRVVYTQGCTHTSGWYTQGCTIGGIFPFHCWAELLPPWLFPFHCWVILAVLVQQCSLCRV